MTRRAVVSSLRSRQGGHLAVRGVEPYSRYPLFFKHELNVGGLAEGK